MSEKGPQAAFSNKVSTANEAAVRKSAAGDFCQI